MVRFLAVLGLAPAVFSSVAADATSAIDLGGLRQAKAVLTVTDAEYVVKVRMLPVECFDAPTNARLNREKARELALLALAKHLSAGEAAEFSVSGVQINGVGTDGMFYTLALRVPQEGVSVVREREKPPAKHGEDRVAFTSELFTRKKDYQNTLEKLTAAALADVQTAEEKPAEDAAPREAFGLALAEIEERGLKNLENLRKEIQADVLLLSVEREDLDAALDEQKVRIQKQVKEAVKRHEAKEELP